MTKKKELTIREKNELVDSVIDQLKKEYVGIDEQIDIIMNNVRAWYIYPNLLDHPVVVNCWGLTGCGKTSLIKRIVALMGLEEDMQYFNFAEIGENTSAQIESQLENHISNDKPNRIFVYDEFQYAATLDSMGAEKDKREGLKPFWELLDTGMLNKKVSLYEIRSVTGALYYLDIISKHTPIIFKDGQWLNIKECLKYLDPTVINGMSEYFTLRGAELDDDRKELQVFSDSPYNTSPVSPVRASINGGIFRVRYMSDLVDLYNLVEGTYIHRDKMCEMLKNLNFEETVKFIYNVAKKAAKGVTLDFTKSIIFVLGNLDEAYTMSFDVDPDMSPDQFYAMTKKISIVDIKGALQKRFRNEQIARLGNVHVIYPSFSSESFRNIIKLNLSQYASKVEKEINFEIGFDSTVIDMIYKEAVFPTHGTRPIFSTINDLIKNKLPEVMRYIDENITEPVKKLTYWTSGKKLIVTIFGENKRMLGDVEFHLSLSLGKLRKSRGDERQALTAVHESGHFVVYAALTGNMPEKLCSCTASSDTNGFMMKKTDEEDKDFSYQNILTDIKVSLAGAIAEEIVYGSKNRSVGATSDLVNATVAASRCIRSFGFGDHLATITYMKDAMTTKDGMIINPDNQEDINEDILELLRVCRKEVKQLLLTDEWHKMLIESSKYLAKHAAMTQKKMKQIYSKVPDHMKCDKRERFYRDILAKL